MILRDKQRAHRLAKEGFWIVIGQVASFAGALALIRVLTKYLDPSQYGQLALGLTVAALATQVITGGVSASIGRFYSVAAESNELRDYAVGAWSLMRRSALAVVVAGAVLMVALRWLGHAQWLGLTAAAIGLSVSSGVNTSLGAIQAAARQRAIVALHTGLDAWLKILFSFGAISLLGTSSTSVVIGYVASSLLVTLSQYHFLRRTIPPVQVLFITRSRFGSRMWAYAWPFSAWGLFTAAQQVSDRWALEAFAATNDVGRYAVLFQLGYSPTAVATGMAATFLGPILYQRSGSGTNASRNANVHSLSWRLTWASVAMTTAAVIVAFALHEQIFALLVAAPYRTYSYLLPWVVLAGGLFAAGQVLGLKLLAEMRSAALMPLKISTAILGIGMNVYGASMSGVVGVVWALVGFSGVYFLWITLLARRQLLLPSLNR